MGNCALCRRYSATRGFTLVEILVSFTLLSVILTMMYAGMSIVHRSSNKGEARINTTNKVRPVHIFLRRQLQGALPLPLEQTKINNTDKVFFDGTAQRLQYVATMPGYLQRGGVYKQTLELVESNNDFILQFHYEPINFLDGATSKVEPVVLLTGLKGASFQYRGRDQDKTLAPWENFWDEKASIPSLIRIDLSFVEDEHNTDTKSAQIPTNWPSLIVAPARVY